MALSLRKKQWLGALSSITLQTLLFYAIVSTLGDLASAIIILGINIVIATQYKTNNPYFIGMRWATFWNLGLASLARHTYWYPDTLSSFATLRDFNNPLGAFTLLCQGNTEEIIMIGSTSFLILVFYSFVSRWPEWTGRWEMLRRAPFSASMGLQTVIFVTVAYPTPTTIILALSFASVISPILRRQIRFNHVIFMMLVPLFALGSPPLAIIFALIGGLAFLYFVSVERALSAKIASYTFFLGVAFIALFFSIAENRVVANSSPTAGGLYAVATFVGLMSVAYLLLFKGEHSHAKIRNFHLLLTPKKFRESSWWHIRDHWVDREIDCRVNKRYTFKGQKPDIGLFFFGPKHWAPGSENYAKVDYAKINMTPSVITLCFYSVWILIDAVLGLTTGSKTVTISGLGIGFSVIFVALASLVWLQFRQRDFYKLPSILMSVFSTIVITGLMGLIIYTGITSNSQVLEQAAGTSPASTPATVDESKTITCPCHEDHKTDEDFFNNLYENNK